MAQNLALEVPAFMSVKLHHPKVVQKAKVLVVDDNKFTRLTIRRVLAARGFADITEAEDGTDAFAEMRFWVPSLILTDWAMSPMGGAQFLKKLRHKNNYPLSLIPVIVLTSHSNGVVLNTALEAGANQILAKPIVPNTIYERISRVFNDGHQFVLDGDYYRLVRGDKKKAEQQETGVVETKSEPVKDSSDLEPSDTAWYVD